QFRALRAAEFPWTADTVYLNNASIGPIPERTRRALDEFTAKRTAPHLLPDRELQAGLQAARVAVARLVNAEPAEIALATNTSHGLNLAACALPLQRGAVGIGVRLRATRADRGARARSRRLDGVRGHRRLLAPDRVQPHLPFRRPPLRDGHAPLPGFLRDDRFGRHAGGAGHRRHRAIHA